MFKKILALSLVGTFLVLGTGCSVKRQESTVTSNTQYSSSYGNLTSGSFYIIHKKKPQSLITLNSSSANVLWGNNDSYQSIPTLRPGDKMIFYSTKDFTPKFTMTRYMDLGWTFGISGLTQDESGRYRITNKQNETYYFPQSDASELLQLKTESLTFEQIGKGKLTSQNVTPFGTVVGLRKNAIYKCHIFEGSVEHIEKLAAIYKAFGKWEDYSTTNFKFAGGKKQIIEIEIPSYFNSGYYTINGAIFRYSAANKWDDNTNFNVPNVVPETEQSSTDSTTSSGNISDGANSDYDADSLKQSNATQTVDTKGNKKFTVSLSDGSDMTGLTGRIVDAKQLIHNLTLSDDNKSMFIEMNVDKTGDFKFTVNGTDQDIKVTVEDQ
jgi:hypothetical protein